uniref:Uncharacterized protein n=1 Tax=Noccaea caerulescens TaxID=107243 RepID=A0A1J3E0L8_NOCCA
MDNTEQTRIPYIADEAMNMFSCNLYIGSHLRCCWMWIGTVDGHQGHGFYGRNTQRPKCIERLRSTFKPPLQLSLEHMYLKPVVAREQAEQYKDAKRFRDSGEGSKIRVCLCNA